MLIPDFWAEASNKVRTAERQITVRRFGWSLISQDDAQRHAEERIQDATKRILAGEKLERREEKAAYNGAVGVPIREEVLERHPHCVITRNLYGARCLNTPNVLFADIDFDTPRKPSAYYWSIFFFMLIGFSLGKNLYGFGIAIVFALASWIIGKVLGSAWWAWKLESSPSEEQLALQRIDQFLDKHPLWHLRLYRTPAGIRLLAMHQTFGPDDTDVAQIFEEIRADKIFVQMCTNQHCFRARVSAKPWRIGIQSHLKPRPGVWPISAERMPERLRWVADYEQKAKHYAACRFMMTKGHGGIDPIADEVRRLHDEMCGALSDLPLA